MAYFNHAFNKVFLGTGKGVSGLQLPAGLVTSDAGYVTTQYSIPTYGLNQLHTYAMQTYDAYLSGYFGAFYSTGANANKSWTGTGDCCSIYFAGSAIYSSDKIGPFAGGYQETNKSKMVNPKYVSRFYRVDPCLPSNNVIHIGNTPYTDDRALELTITDAGSNLVDGVYTDIPLYSPLLGGGTGLIVTITVTGNIATSVQITNGGTGWSLGNVALIDPSSELPVTGGGENAQPEFEVSEAGIAADCCREFLCGETYTLRVDIKGSPALRYLNHNAYILADYYTGCCPTGDIAPTPVDSTLVMIGWANRIVNYPVVSPFVLPIVIDEAGNEWYKPGTLDFFGQPVANTWDKYVSTGHTEGACAGLILNGAYVDTKFGDCTFQVSDFYEKEPVRLYASEVDLNGDPCEFTGICVITECQPIQANGFGETVLRELILSEKYRQNFFHSDFRIREITQGNQIVNVIDRNALYTKYYLLHNVPRFNNPSSTFDNDQYLLEFVTFNNIPSFEDDIINWLDSCGNLCEFEEYGCENKCTPVVPVVPGGGFRPLN
jgi:hypothetical protein